MKHVTTITETDLDDWARRLDARAKFPELLRRLVRTTATGPVDLEFASDEGIQRHGWDGLVLSETRHQYVPIGRSAWELGVSEDPKRKADEDYEKRTRDPKGVDPAQATFVFATPRRWPGKEEWASAKKADGVWREVRVLDAKDLQSWLEAAPSAHLWMAGHLGRKPEGLSDLDTFWANWSDLSPPITPAFLLAGRDSTVKRIHRWLAEPSSPLSLKTESRDESLAILAAAIQKLPEAEREKQFFRTVVVEDEAAWNYAVTFPARTILVPRFDASGVIAGALRRGHTVFTPLGRADGPAIEEAPRLAVGAATEALVAEGVEDSRARELAALARRSLIAYRRQSIRGQAPEWAQPSKASTIIPAMLAGSWTEDKDGDREAIAELGGSPYEKLIPQLTRWANEPDPPLRTVGGAWFLVSERDAWSLLGWQITRPDLERFERVALEVLGSPNPVLALEPDDRPLAALRHITPKYSSRLAEGIAKTLALMASDEKAGPLQVGVTPPDFAARVVWQLFEKVSADPSLWESLTGVLPLLAEAAPDAFLSAVEEGTKGSSPILARVFHEGPSVFSSSPHTGLLWALETLAWSPQHLGRVALLLARLSEIDPGVKVMNRPANSLNAIFRTALPQTSSSYAQRLVVIDSLRRENPKAAWELQCSLLPHGPLLLLSNARPKFIETPPDSRSITNAELYATASDIGDRLRSDAGVDGEKWSKVIGLLPSLTPQGLAGIKERLLEIASQTPAEVERVLIWDSVRRLVSRHRAFPSATWSLPEEALGQLDEVASAFEPAGVCDRSLWPFEELPDLPRPREDDWQTQERLIAETRNMALSDVNQSNGLDGVVDLARRVKLPFEVGATLGRRSDIQITEGDFLRAHLDADPELSKMARGFIAGRVASRGIGWATELLAREANGFTATQVALFLTTLPSGAAIWDLAASLGADIDGQYWQLVYPYGVSDPPAFERVARGLLKAGRILTAVDLLGMHTVDPSPPSPALVMEVLEAAFLQEHGDKTPRLASFPLHVNALFDLLEKSEGLDQSRIATLEWAALAVFQVGEHQPKALQREMSHDPQFLVHVMSLVFRADGQEPRARTAEDDARARNGYQLLSTWRTLPGSLEGGGLDASALKSWVSRVREIAADQGLLTSADGVIGELLSGSPEGLDGMWPHEAVCDVIQSCESPRLEQKFCQGAYNSRGVVTKHFEDGGEQEAQLALKFETRAAAVESRWPRVGAMLRRLARTYRREENRADQAKELRSDLDHW